MQRALVVLFVAATLVGCTKTVDPGYVGMVMTPEGLTGTPLQPGRHGCWGRDKMVLMETVEPTKTEKLSVLCADDLNFKFDLKIRSRLKAADGKSMKEVLNRQGSQMDWSTGSGILKHENLYNNYVAPAARSIARGIVSKYTTTQIRENREEIQKAITTDLTAAMKGTPMEVVMVATSNFDYPQVITAAVEKRRQKEIEIDEEKAKQAMELLRAENRLKIAQKMKIVRASEAEAEAAYIKIMGNALTDRFIGLKAVEANMKLYESAAAGDRVIVAPPATGLMIGGSRAVAAAK
jgi:hypothetical protein